MVFLDKSTMIKATGITHTAASAILQSKKKRLITIMVVDKSAPASSGIQWDDAVSMVAQSVIMVFVRSARSFLPKNDNGSFLSFSASPLRLMPLST